MTWRLINYWTHPGNPFQQEISVDISSPCGDGKILPGSIVSVDKPYDGLGFVMGMKRGTDKIVVWSKMTKHFWEVSLADLQTTQIRQAAQYLCSSLASPEKNKLSLRKDWSVVHLDTTAEAMEDFGEVKFLNRFFFEEPLYFNPSYPIDLNNQNREIRKNALEVVKACDQLLATPGEEEADDSDSPCCEAVPEPLAPSFELTKKFTVIGYETVKQRLWMLSDDFALSSYTVDELKRCRIKKLPPEDIFSYKDIARFSQLETILCCFPDHAVPILSHTIMDENKRKITIQQFSQFCRLLVRLPKLAPELVTKLLKDPDWFTALVTRLNPPPALKLGATAHAARQLELGLGFIRSLLMGVNLIMDSTVNDDLKRPLVQGLHALTRSVAKALHEQDPKDKRIAMLASFVKNFRYWNNELGCERSLSQSCPSYVATKPGPSLQSLGESGSVSRRSPPLSMKRSHF